MAFTLTFLHGLHLQTLPRVATNLRLCTTPNRIKYARLHRSLSKSVSKDIIDSDSNESQIVEQSDSSRSHTQADGSIEKNVLTENHDSVDCNLDLEINRNKHEHKYLKHSPGHSRRKTNITPSQYFKKSWLNYYSNISEETPDTSVHSNVQTESLKKADDRLVQRNKLENEFGALSMKISGKTEQLDERNPNERIDEQLPEDTDKKRDGRLDIPLTRYGRINKDRFYYTRKISILGQEGKIKEAIAIYEDWMMVRDRVMPTKRTFVTLIGILGRVGYTKKAFELFGKMKQLGLDPVDRIYTSLFNACANSPSPAEALRSTEHLLNHMKEAQILPNLITVKAAMKALAVCGDFSRAFTLLDETSVRLRLDCECFNHLLMACISDKEAGFRRALQVWQKMALYRIRPDTFAFNLLIRSARDCGIGDLDTISSCFNLDSLEGDRSAPLGLLESISLDASLSGENKLPGRPAAQTNSARRSRGELKVIGNKMKIHAGSEQQGSSVDPEQKIVHTFTHTAISKQENGYDNRCIPTGDRVDNTGDEKNEFCKHVSVTDLPDIYPHVVHDAEVTPKEGQGRTTVLNHSKAKDIHQSLYSDLLSDDARSNNGVLEESKCSKISLRDLRFSFGRLALLGGAEKLISSMEALKLRPDLKTFVQILACLPNDELSEFHLLTLMEERGIKPDIDFFNDMMIRRFQRKQSDTIEAVLKLISKLRLTPNMRTYAAIALTCRREKDAKQLLQDMKEANLEPNSVIMGHLLQVSASNYSSKLYLLKTMESLGLKVTQPNIVLIEKSIALTKRKIVEAEKTKNSDSFYLTEHYQRSFQTFLRYYKSWLQRVELEKPRHPWDSFKPPAKQEEEKCLKIVG